MLVLDKLISQRLQVDFGSCLYKILFQHSKISVQVSVNHFFQIFVFKKMATYRFPTRPFD